MNELNATRLSSNAVGMCMRAGVGAATFGAVDEGVLSRCEAANCSTTRLANITNPSVTAPYTTLLLIARRAACGSRFTCVVIVARACVGNDGRLGMVPFISLVCAFCWCSVGLGEISIYITHTHTHKASRG